MIFSSIKRIVTAITLLVRARLARVSRGVTAVAVCCLHSVRCKGVSPFISFLVLDF